MKDEHRGYAKLLKHLPKEQQLEIAREILVERYEQELDKPNGKPAPSDHTNELRYFVECRHPELSWADRLEVWNKEHPQQQYKRVDNMRRAYLRAKKRWGKIEWGVTK